MIEFHRVMPESLEYLGGDSIRYLDDAAKNSNNYFGAYQAIEQAKRGSGHIYQVIEGKNLLGCFFFTFVENHLGLCMTLILLGGKNLRYWAKSLSHCLYKIAETEKVDEFGYLGRKGFSRYFPELQYVASIYRKKLTSPI